MQILENLFPIFWSKVSTEIEKKYSKPFLATWQCCDIQAHGQWAYLAERGVCPCYWTCIVESHEQNCILVTFSRTYQSVKNWNIKTHAYWSFPTDSLKSPVLGSKLCFFNLNKNLCSTERQAFGAAELREGPWALTLPCPCRWCACTRPWGTPSASSPHSTACIPTSSCPMTGLWASMGMRWSSGGTWKSTSLCRKYTAVSTTGGQPTGPAVELALHYHLYRVERSKAAPA